MTNLQQFHDTIAGMRAAREREERLTRLFLAWSTAAAGAVILFAFAMLFATWPVEVF